MKVWIVSLDFETMNGGDWNELLVVAAPEEGTAEAVARDYVDARHIVTDVRRVVVRPAKGPRVLGRLEVLGVPA